MVVEVVMVVEVMVVLVIVVVVEMVVVLVIMGDEHDGRCDCGRRMVYLGGTPERWNLTTGAFMAPDFLHSGQHF